MTINLKKPDIAELKPRLTVFGVGGGGGNAVNNMITCGLEGVEFVVANTDAQALMTSKSERIIQLGAAVTEGLGAGSHPEVGQAAAEECIDEIMDYLSNTHMCFVTAGMGGGTGTGAAPVVAKAAREKGILTVGVVTKPFQFEGQRRMKTAEQGIEELQKCVDTLIVIPNQNLFRIANEKTTFSEAFAMADQVLFSGVACITDLMVKEGLINLDFADVRSVMHQMGKAMMGTGEASGDDRAVKAAEAAISNPLLDEVSMRGAKGLLISITGGRDLTLFEVDEAATRIREEVDPDANIILGATHDDNFEGKIRVSVVATGIDSIQNGVEHNPAYADDSQLKRAADNMLARRQEAIAPSKVLRRSLVETTTEAQKMQVDESRLATNFASQFSSSLPNSFARKNEEETGFADLEDEIVSDQAGDSMNPPRSYSSYRETEAYNSLNRQSSNSFSRERESRFETSQPMKNPNDVNASAVSTLTAGGETNSLNQWNVQPQVKPLTQELPEISDFPSIVQHTRLDIDELSCFEQEESDSPRGLWQKITHRLRSKQTSIDLASLEPVDQNPDYEEIIERMPYDQEEPLYESRVLKNKEQKQLEPNLDIPAFLRQQANS